MSDSSATALSKEECFHKAEECRAFAKAAKLENHLIMLTHIAETWERISDGVIQAASFDLRVIAKIIPCERAGARRQFARKTRQRF